MKLERYIRNKLKDKSICLMTHIIAGYPSFDDNWRALEIMAERNVDVVEMQMPFSEPIADGPVFVRANQESLKRGTTIEKYFKLMQRAADQFDFPILMMGYYNTVFKMGEDNFLDQLKNSGGCGFIIPDLPVEQGINLFENAKNIGLAPIGLVAPTSPDNRLKSIGEAGSGFIYVVARAGVTGTQSKFNDTFENYLQHCRNQIDLPLAVGFGISNKHDIEYLAGKAEIAIIGTALLKVWEESGEQGLRKFFKQINS
jgi:tryptophan synthase alpha chain